MRLYLALQRRHISPDAARPVLATADRPLRLRRGVGRRRTNYAALQRRPLRSHGLLVNDARGAQQQTRRTPLLLPIDGTDRRTLD